MRLDRTRAHIGFETRSESLWCCGGSTAGWLAMLRDADAVAWRSWCCNDTCASGRVRSSYADMYNATSNSWTRYPAGLGQARHSLVAVSLASGLVFFAGGHTGAALLRACFAIAARALCDAVAGRRPAGWRCCVMLMLLRACGGAGTGLTHAHQAAPTHRTWTCTTRRATAGPHIPQASGKLGVS